MTRYNPVIMKSIEDLGYRVTVGDIATQSGLTLNLAQQGLLAIASEAGGHLQVAETGDIVYLFPKNFRGILRNKNLRLRLTEWLGQAWKIIFYLIRISFGIVLLLSIALMFIAIMAIVIALNASQEGDSRGNERGGIIFIPNLTDLFIIFSPNYESNPTPSRSSSRSLNFLESIYSFLFGDGNPNGDLEEKRWQQIGQVINQNKGAIAAEQIAPYLDNISTIEQENEDYILPVLSKFNGYPQVSPQGDIIYYFPELQVTAQKRESQGLVPYLQEKLWQFSQASSGQIMTAIGLGGVNLVLALMLGSLFQDYTFSGDFLLFIQGIYGVLLAYATSFLSIPLVRYFWIQWRNKRIEFRNQKRQARADYLSLSPASLRQKLDYARQFATETVITEADITYSTDKDMLEQEADRSDKIDEEWRRRLGYSE